MKTIFLFLLVTLATVSSSYSQWKNANYTTKFSRISALATDGKLLYAADFFGVYVEEQNAWKPIGTFPDSLIQDLLVLDTAIFAATLNGIFYSKYDGKKYDGIWKSVGNAAGLPLPLYSYMNQKIVNIPTKLLLMCNGNLYSYTFGTDIWKSESLPQGNIEALSSNSFKAYVGNTNYAGAYQYSSSDKWEFMKAFRGEFNSEVINIFFQKGSKVLTCFRKAGDSLGVSIDNGQTWIKSLMPKGFSYRSYFELNDSVLFVGENSNPNNNEGGYYMSMDYGDNWTLIDSGLGEDTLITSTRIVGEHLYCSTDQGNIYKRKLSGLSGIIYNGGGALQAIHISNASYEWFFNNVKIDNASGEFLQATQNGKYKVKITYNAPALRVAVEKSVTFEYEVIDLGVTALENPVESANILVFPNPAKNILNIETSDLSALQSVQLFNKFGQVVYSQKTPGISEVIHLSELSLESGVYFLKLQGKDFTKVIKVLLEKF